MEKKKNQISLIKLTVNEMSENRKQVTLNFDVSELFEVLYGLLYQKFNFNTPKKSISDPTIYLVRKNANFRILVLLS